jgi:beta-galactosidase
MQSPWAWSDSVSSWTWPGFEDKPITVEVYADAEEVALLLDGTEVAREKVGSKYAMHAVIETVYRPGELTAVAYRDGAEIGRTSLSTAGEHDLAVSADRTTLRADDTDLAFIAIELRDADGILVTCADVDVTVEVSGAGVLAGFSSGNPKTIERFDATTRRTFDGRALAIIRPLPGPEKMGSFEAGGRSPGQSGDGDGEITVTVTADGLSTVVVRLQVSAAQTS